ncbi:hypothetical protein KsCSTR_29610 [Candidatus Kuenenia stuttgartiensis]|uniref:Uncharacterized protein n=1 Tax=Kuenenia stuttgartiensis TaxID=174633 RepID=A0A6G7GRV6_KUEST|nr:hypothetical protein KsCSTR_29610 [Candidatus Kuenenia stuttgartiensis]
MKNSNNNIVLPHGVGSEAFACLGMNAGIPVVANTLPLRSQKTEVLQKN